LEAGGFDAMRELEVSVSDDGSSEVESVERGACLWLSCLPRIQTLAVTGGQHTQTKRMHTMYLDSEMRNFHQESLLI